MFTYILVHTTAQNSSDNFPSYPPDNSHWSDIVSWRGGKIMGKKRSVQYIYRDGLPAKQQTSSGT